MHAVAGTIGPHHLPRMEVAVRPCRDCPALIFFGWVLRKDGTIAERAHPFEYEAATGNFYVVYEGATPRPQLHEGAPVLRSSYAAAREALTEAGVRLYVSHYANCPAAQRWRDKGQRRG